MRGDHEAIVVGCSAGGMQALEAIIPQLPLGLPQAVVVVQHLHPGSGGYLAEFFARCCPLPVKEAEDKEEIRPGVIYLAVANYHLLIERHRSFALSVDDRVRFARPSIDVLFQSAALAYGAKLVGVVLTGANDDGAAGLAAIKARGGVTVVQDPSSAEVGFMPKAALAATSVDHVLPLVDIARLLGGYEGFS